MYSHFYQQDTKFALSEVFDEIEQEGEKQCYWILTYPLIVYSHCITWVLLLWSVLLPMMKIIAASLTRWHGVHGCRTLETAAILYLH